MSERPWWRQQLSRLRLRERLADRDPWRERRDIRRAATPNFVRTAYQIMLRRDGDADGVENYVTQLRDGSLTRDGVLDEMLTSMEMRAIPYENGLRSLHLSRCDFVRLLPRASHILDLGGTDQDDPAGSLVNMGYPYCFDQLTIVDLPHHERHELYSGSARADAIHTPSGPVQYRYHSMVDLSSYDDAAFDLVFSGQSIEHITQAEAEKMLHEIRRILVPGGHFALDTPNRRATAAELGASLMNPDHKIEYTDGQLRAMLVDAGFEIVGAYGLAYAGAALEQGVFDGAAVARNHGVFADVANCYLLAYVCRATGPSDHA
ncbi:MAG: class I SAM-dependent methyltransferase [Actinomycetota bacterium]